MTSFAEFCEWCYDFLSLGIGKLNAVSFSAMRRDLRSAKRNAKIHSFEAIYRDLDVFEKQDNHEESYICLNINLDGDFFKYFVLDGGLDDFKYEKHGSEVVELYFLVQKGEFKKRCLEVLPIYHSIKIIDSEFNKHLKSYILDSGYVLSLGEEIGEDLKFEFADKLKSGSSFDKQGEAERQRSFSAGDVDGIDGNWFKPVEGLRVMGSQHQTHHH